MKLISFFSLALVFLGCQHKPDPNRYLSIYHQLVNNGIYKDVVGLQILPRDEDEYFVILSKPSFVLWPTLVRDDSVELAPGETRELLDSLQKYFPTTAQQEETSILKRIAKLMSFIQRESLWGARGTFTKDTTHYVIEFYLTRHKTLRYDNKPLGRIARHLIDSLSVATWIDSSWVYYEDKPG
jgi:hypothetical protein